MSGTITCFAHFKQKPFSMIKLMMRRPIKELANPVKSSRARGGGKHMSQWRKSSWQSFTTLLKEMDLDGVGWGKRGGGDVYATLLKGMQRQGG